MQHIKYFPAHLEIFSSKQLDPHDGEDEPENDTHHEHIEDAGDGLNQSIDYNLKQLKNDVFAMIEALGCHALLTEVSLH